MPHRSRARLVAGSAAVALIASAMFAPAALAEEGVGEVNATATEVQPNAYTYAAIPHTSLTAVSADSEEPTGELPNGPKEKAVDGDTNTYWHTKWQNANPVPPPPHEIVIKVGQAGGIQNIGKVDVVPRQSSNASGRSHEWQLFYSVSDDIQGSANWEEIAAGAWPEDHDNRLQTKSIVFPRLITATHFKFVAKSSWGGRQGTTEQVTSMAEFIPYTATESTAGPTQPTEPTNPGELPAVPTNALVIQDAKLKVELDAALPYVRNYTDKASSKQMRGKIGGDSVSVILNNSANAIPATVGTPVATDTSVTYPLTFTGGSMNVVYTLTEGVLTMSLTSVTGTGGTKINSVEMPTLDMVSAVAAQPGASLSLANVDVNRNNTGNTDRFIAINGSTPVVEGSGSAYAFANTAELAAALETNAIVDDKPGDGTTQISHMENKRWLSSVRSASNARFGTIRAGVFTVESQFATDGLGAASKIEAGKNAEWDPFVRIAFTTDANSDNAVDWQDSAIRYRDIDIEAKGSDTVPTTVITRIPFNIVSQATHPFLKTLDDTKRVALATDYLGQQVMLKGYQAEGHDSAHPDYGGNYNFRAGGLADINKLAADSEALNATLGVHVNVTEQYAEAKTFGDTPFFEGRKGWNWMNQAWIIDGRNDLGSGKVLQRFQQFRDEVHKNLDWIYVDVFYDFGWKADRLTRELNAQGWRVGTEWSDKFERMSIWSHWSADEKYGGVANKGINSQIIRFIDNSNKDTFNPHPILGNAQIKDFEGWTGQVDWNTFYNNIWNNNLPTKFLQLSPIMKWDSTAGSITFANGTVATGKAGLSGTFNADNLTRFTYDGAEVLHGTSYLLPWQDNGTTDGAKRLYHYNRAGGSTTWKLTDSWKDQATLKLYKLTDQGRVAVGDVAVTGGNVTIQADAGQPYVLYPSTAVPDAQAPEWGKHSLIKDPGFNANSLDAYAKTGAASVVKADRSQYVAKLGEGASSIAQALNNNQPLEAGTYSAWAYVQIGENNAPGTRDVKVSVSGNGVTAGKYQPKVGNVPTTEIGQTTVLNATASDEKFRFYYQRVRVVFTTDGSAPVTFKVEAGDGTTPVYVDDLRIVKYTQANDASPTAQTVLFEDFEGTDTGYWPFVTGPAQGGDARTQLARKNAPYTQKGWNPGNYGASGKLVDDVFAGDWSLKLHEENAGLVLKSTPQSMPFKAGHRYRVSFDYQNGTADYYSFVTGYDTVRVGNRPNQTIMGAEALPAKHTTAKYSHEFVAGNCGATFVGIFSTGGQVSQADLIIDNLRVEDLGASGEVQACAAARIALPQGVTALVGGETGKVYTTITNNESSAITGIKHTLQLPEGWTVTPAGSTEYPVEVASLAPGETSYAEWNVTPPAVPTSTTANASIAYTGPNGATAATASVNLTVLRGLQPGKNWLSDLPFLNAVNGWGPIERDAANGENQAGDGRPLKIGTNKTFEKGLGTHAVSSVEFDLNGRCTKFTSEVGVADYQQGRGSVGFEVWGDGRKLAESGTLTGSRTHAFDVEITNVKRLRLKVNDGGNGIGNDHGNWGDAAVTCGTAPTPEPSSTPTPQPTPTPEPSVTPATPVVDRIAGDTRIDTALKAAADPAFDKTVAVLTSGSSFPDTLSAAPLADALNAPLLLTGGKSLEKKVLDALKARGTTKVTIVGGDKTVAPAVERALRAAGIQVNRVSGADRAATSVNVAKKAIELNPQLERVLVADGNQFADAVSASGVAGRAKAVVILTNGKRMPASSKAFIAQQAKTFKVGAVGGSALAATRSAGLATGANFKQYVGADRYATSALIANAFGAGTKQVLLASGLSFPDALVGGALASERDGVVLLVKANEIPAGASAFLRENKPVRVTLLGGPAVLSTALEGKVAKLIK
ncbi:MAG: endo-alpha-N-acetylgalactosaminidase family protein [Buchananella hordeovulneris]|nr:endo-alpha-N-acetylgalactosaminidase family protein [Buchananella hordeovulneris]